jgi:hypothetical protein
MVVVHVRRQWRHGRLDELEHARMIRRRVDGEALHVAGEGSRTVRSQVRSGESARAPSRCRPSCQCAPTGEEVDIVVDVARRRALARNPHDEATVGRAVGLHDGTQAVALFRISMRREMPR